MKFATALSTVFVFLSLLGGWAGEVMPAAPDTSVWRDPKKSVAERVQALVAQLTQKEKISLVYWLAPGIDRLGIPAYDHGNECLHGIVRPGAFTVFPEAIGMAATFDPDLIHQEATAISDEARAKYNATGRKHLETVSDVLTFWSPVVNMARDPRWGRTQETYGEDPFLTGSLGVAFVRGLQGDDPRYLKVVSTPKHFAGNNEEEGRGGKSIIADERYLQEFELAGFRACITEGKAESIMSAYTAINGVPSSANKWLLTDVLRGQWGFQGYVVSDCGAVSNVVGRHHYVPTPEAAAAACFNAGLDMEGGWFEMYPDVVNNYMAKAIQAGLMKPEVLDHAVTLVLTARFRLGMYDPPALVPYSKIPPETIGSPEHIALARKVGDESMVLLKNDPDGAAPLLPIQPARIKKIMVVGPNANIAQFGDYSGSSTIEAVTPLAGLQARAKKAGITVGYLPWQAEVKTPVPSDVLQSGDSSSSPGLSATYYNSLDLSGAPSGSRVDKKIDFNWAHTAPDPLCSGKEFSAKWTGQIQIKTAGHYGFSLNGDGAYKFSIDRMPVLDAWAEVSATRRETLGTRDLEAGLHNIEIDYHHQGGETGLIWTWSPPATAESLASLKDADLVIAVMGLNPGYEQEGQDRSTLTIPPEQKTYIDRVVAQNPHTVAVLESGSSLAVPELSAKLPALLEAWYPGEEGGDAIADVLFGDYNPSGRLPLTFYASDSQLRPMSEYDLTKGRTYMYLADKPLYPFGHGLSYTSFTYANLKLSPTQATINDALKVSVDVTNSGPCDGEEVVQCYVHARQASVAMPIKQLWALQRVALTKGQTKTVSLKLQTRNFGHWDQASQKFLVEPGLFDILVGASSSDIRQASTLKVQ